MQIRPIKTKIFKEKEHLLPFIISYIPKIKNKTIIVITSKIVALSEARTIPDDGSPKTKVEAIKRESDWAIHTKYIWLTLKNGELMPSAGIDQSNGNKKIVLLPSRAWETARYLHAALIRQYRINCLGIIITDSRTHAFRKGCFGIPIAYAGICGLKNYKGEKDIFGRTIRTVIQNTADALAAAAVLAMGEGSEQTPLAIITGAPVNFRSNINRKELYIDPEDDIYRPFFDSVRKISSRATSRKRPGARP